MTKERIQELIDKQKLTAKDKDEIKFAADVAGIEYTIKGGCRDCWEKVLVKLYEHESAQAAPAVSLDGWRLRNPSVNFEHRGRVYNNATITQMEVGGLHPHILNTYFVKEAKDGAQG